MVALMGKAPQKCKTNRSNPSLRTDILLDRLRGQIRHSSRRDPSEGRAPAGVQSSAVLNARKSLLATIMQKSVDGGIWTRANTKQS